MAQPAERMSTVPATKMMKISGFGLAAAADPQRPQGRPQQQPDADGTVQAHETDIVMNGAENFRQLFGGPGMEANAIAHTSASAP